jgi:hypothetical protein
LPWAIVGGVATSAYMPERATKDLDILLHTADHQAALTALAQAGYTDEGGLGIIAGRQWRTPSGISIDLLWSDAPWVAEALREPYLDGLGYPVLALPYLVLMKLAASRLQDMADVARMLGWADEGTLAAVRQVVQRYSPVDVEDVESLIFLGQQERKTLG